jgi:hypothetical protein
MMRNFLFWLQAFASSVKNPLLCRLLILPGWHVCWKCRSNFQSSAQSPHALLHEALPPEGGREVEQISPGKNMIIPCTTAAFTIPQRSGWASSCCADSPWGSAFFMQFLFVGSQFCTQASFRRLVALPPSPKAPTFGAVG